MENTPKQYLYHSVPKELQGDDLHPLNKLKELGEENPKMKALYDALLNKYNDPKRAYLPKVEIPTLENAKWSDVIQLSPIHPEDLTNTLNEAGFDFINRKFYQIDPDLLDPKNTTIFLNDDNYISDDPKNYADFKSEKLNDLSKIRQGLTDYYTKHKEENSGSLPFLYVTVPHIFYKGSIKNITDISKFPIIEVTGYAKKKL